MMSTKTIIALVAVLGVGAAGYWFFFMRKRGGSSQAALPTPSAPATGATQCQQLAAAINRQQPLGKMLSTPIKRCRAVGGTVVWINSGTKQQKQVCACKG